MSDRIREALRTFDAVRDTTLLRTRLTQLGFPPKVYSWHVAADGMASMRMRRKLQCELSSYEYATKLLN